MILYADVSSPACYLASHRADLLRAAGVDLDLRATESRPRVPVTGRPTAVSVASDERRVVRVSPLP